MIFSAELPKAVNWLDISILILYFAMIISVAVYSRKKASSLNDFLLAGKGMGGIMTAFSYGMTYFSAVIFIGYAGKNGYDFGLAATWIGVGNAIIGALLPWLLFAKRTRRITHHFGTRTMPELFEKRYQSKHIKLIAALAIFLFLVPYAASVYQGLSYLFELVFGIPFWSVVLIMAIITAIYLFFGGYFATVLSDFLQGLIMLVSAIIMVAFVINYQKVGGVVEGMGKLFEDNLGFFPSFTKGGMPFGYTLLMIILLTSFGTWGLPQIIHKFYTVRNEKAIRPATWVSTAFALIIGVIAYLAGCFARYVVDAGSMPADQIMPNVFVEALPMGVLGLIVVLIFSASMSTLAALTLSSSSAVSVDLYKGYIKKDATDKQVNFLMRGLCVLFIAVSVVIAIMRPASIISLMSISWGTLSGSFIAPYIYGLYSKKATKAGAYSGIATGLAVNIIFFIFTLIFPGTAFAAYFSAPAVGVYSMALSMIVMPVVSRFTKKLDNGFVEDIFSVISKKGILGDEPAPEPEEKAIAAK